ncbi:MAG: hypothetical protein K0S72_1859, partial [Arthrobacter sp.]|nr:hypothetical protein [Arthrobacter sp.]
HLLPLRHPPPHHRLSLCLYRQQPFHQRLSLVQQKLLQLHLQEPEQP